MKSTRIRLPNSEASVDRWRVDISLPIQYDLIRALQDQRENSRLVMLSELENADSPASFLLLLIFLGYRSPRIIRIEALHLPELVEGLWAKILFVNNAVG